MPDTRQPVLFVGHGSPMNAIEQNDYTRAWRALGERLGRPRAIVAISAHWQARATAIGVSEELETIHDFGGFPDALFAVQYPARGDPKLARDLVGMLSSAGGAPITEDSSWGLDHGIWSVLAHIFPKADIPVVPVAMDVSLTPDERMALGRSLAALREDGILILGSGNIVHNLRTISWRSAGVGFDWGVEFDEFVREALERGDLDALRHYTRHPAAARAVPTTEHFDPLFYCCGAGEGDSISFPCVGLTMGSISMRSVLFGAPAQA